MGTLTALAVWNGRAEATPSIRHRSSCSELENFIAKQGNVSINGVLANIGADGSKAEGASPGVVVASPSRSDPDCKPLPLIA